MAQRKTRDLVVHGLGRLKIKLVPRAQQEKRVDAVKVRRAWIVETIRKHFPAPDKLQVHTTDCEYTYITYEREPGKPETVFDNLTPYMAQYIVWRLGRPEVGISLRNNDERIFLQRLEILDKGANYG